MSVENMSVTMGLEECITRFSLFRFSRRAAWCVFWKVNMVVTLEWQKRKEEMRAGVNRDLRYYVGWFAMVTDLVLPLQEMLSLAATATRTLFGLGSC